MAELEDPIDPHELLEHVRKHLEAAEGKTTGEHSED